MRSLVSPLRILPVIPILFLIFTSFALAQSPQFPPGIRLIQLKTEGLPVGVEVHAIEVDWTNPLLALDVSIAPSSATGIARPWEQVVNEDLKIQLGEPIPGDSGYSLPFNAIAASHAALPDPTSRTRESYNVVSPEPADQALSDSHVHIGGILPWFFDGGRAVRDPDPVSPLGEGSARVGVRWLGRPRDWRTKPPDFTLRDRLIFSSLDRARGRTQFILVINRSETRKPLAQFAEWIGETFPPTAWLAIHSMGLQSIVGQSDWRLGPRPDPPPIERVGVALVMRKKRRGELVDYARIGRPSLSASSSEGNHLPESATNGLLWPAPLQPNLWMSRRSGPEAERIADYKLDFAQPRPVRAVRLIHAEAAGWSRDFNPAELLINIKSRDRDIPIQSITIENAGAYSTIVLNKPRLIEQIEIQFTRPNRFETPAPARLGGIQLLGPWDGNE